MKETVIAIVGPTAVGKSELGIEVAKRFNGEVISGDAFQVYKYFDIGTAKIAPTEMQGIPHHLLDIIEPTRDYSARDFKVQTETLIPEITKRDRLPIIVGGSGLYIQSALYDYNFPTIKRDEARTLALEKEAKNEGIERIYQKLTEVDPEQAALIHPNNHRRVIRALEIYETTGKTKSTWEREQTTEPAYHNILIGLEMDRKMLYEQINKRVDLMMEKGLLDEVKALYDQGLANTQAMKAIGYKEFIPYFNQELSLEACLETLKQNSRRYAKRQYTWFRNRLDVSWYSVTPENKQTTYTKILHRLAGDLE